MESSSESEDSDMVTLLSDVMYKEEAGEWKGDMVSCSFKEEPQDAPMVWCDGESVDVSVCDGQIVNEGVSGLGALRLANLVERVKLLRILFR